MEKQITVKEFAQITHLACRTISAYVTNGTIKATLIGKRYWVSTDELEHFATLPRRVGRPIGSGLGEKHPKTFLPIQDVPEKFWQLVDKKEPELCWPWLGCTMKHNYGVFNYAGTRRLAHRVVYELTYGPIEPSNLTVCHHCDNPNCVNPYHLFLGTNVDNTADRVAKGRTRTNPAKGEEHYKHKLIASDIAEIKQLSKDGVPQRKIADIYHVRQSSIWGIIHNKNWKCLLPQTNS
jgi:hypothetical protein